MLRASLQLQTLISLDIHQDLKLTLMIYYMSILKLILTTPRLGNTTKRRTKNIRKIRN